ncbi:MAG: hypothetical protein OES25_07885 [Acidobacteriota bacterium]|nr:hypothetical protein [Acidobacteriota bacterium]
MRLRNDRIVFSLSLVLALTVLGCGGPSGGPAGAEGSAERVVSDFYDALNAKDYDAAKTLYSPESLAAIADPSSSDDRAFREWADGETRSGSVAQIKIVTSEDGPSEGSTLILFDVVYGDDSTARHTVTVVLIDGAWKMGLIS